MVFQNGTSDTGKQTGDRKVTVLIDSRYLIVEELAEDEPRHFRVRSRETGDLYSLFAYREAEPVAWVNLWNRVSALPASTRGIVLENFVFRGQRYVVTPALPPHVSLADHLGKPRLLDERSFQTRLQPPREMADSYARAQAGFARPTAAETTPAIRRAPVAEVPAVDPMLKPGSSKLAVVPSELEIFEARTVRVDFGDFNLNELIPVTATPAVVGGRLDFQVPPKPFVAAFEGFAETPRFGMTEEPVPSAGLSPFNYVLYGAGIAALVAAFAAFFLR
jgi:hypothetical protein